MFLLTKNYINIKLNDLFKNNYFKKIRSYLIKFYWLIWVYLHKCTMIMSNIESTFIINNLNYIMDFC